MELIASLPADTPLGEVAERVRRIETLGFDTVHVSETIHDPFIVSALALEHSRSLQVRTSMAVAFPRSPMVIAYAAWDLARFSGGRFQLGLATQVRGNMVGRFSMPWTDPEAQLRDYVASVRAIFASFQTGAELNHEGSHYSFNRLQPYFNPGPLDHDAPSVWTGGVNHRMCALAGAVSDGFVTHATSSHPVLLREQVLPALRSGAELAGRSDGGPKIAVVSKAITGHDRAAVAAAREAARSELAFLYSTPAYRRTLEVFGLAELGPALTERAATADWEGLSGLLTDEVLRALIPEATHAELPETLNTWYGGLCDGLALGIPDDEDHDVRFREVLREVSAIPTRAES